MTVVTVVMVRLHHRVHYVVQEKVRCLGRNELESDSERKKSETSSPKLDYLVHSLP